MASKSPTSLAEFVLAGPNPKKPGYGTWLGLNTAVKDFRALPAGATYDASNWITGRYGDHIELRRGQARLGATQRAGSGRVTGLGIGLLSNGTQVPFFSYGRSLAYYDAAGDDTHEVTLTNILPAPASGEDVSFMPYQNLAGAFMYATSPLSSIYKIPVANPQSVVDQKSTTYRFGFAKIGQNRMFGVQRRGIQAYSVDNNDVFLSHIDHQTIADYISAYNPVIAGNEFPFSPDGVQNTFTWASLAALVSNPTATAFQIAVAAPIAAGKAISGITTAGNAVVNAVGHGFSFGDNVMVLGASGMTQINGAIAQVTQVVDADHVAISVNSSSFSPWTSGGSIYPVEVFFDDTNGVLSSNLGGTGTINYATGAGSVTFHTTPIALASGGSVNYMYELAGSGGIIDFSYSATRLAGEGNFLPEKTGGAAQAVWPLQNIEYAFHEFNVWAITIDSTNDLTQSNQPYRETFGVPYHLAVFPTADGILLLNDALPAQPQFSILQIPQGSPNTTVIPAVLSLDLDLAAYGFDQCVVFRWGEYDFLCAKQPVNGITANDNGVCFIRNIYSGLWNLLDYNISCLAEYIGTLLSGDSLSNNLYTLFSGLDDDGVQIPNYWKTAYSNLGMSGLKVANRMELKGLIQRSQKIKVSVSLDNGDYVDVFTIDGAGTYVNSSTPVGVGSNTVGSNVVGGGGTIQALPFTVDFFLGTDLFEYISVRLEALDVGWAQVDRLALKDIRLRRRTLAPYNEVGVS